MFKVNDKNIRKKVEYGQRYFEQITLIVMVFSYLLKVLQKICYGIFMLDLNML